MARKPARQETLEDFALKGMDHGRLTGISVGMHAIPDAFLLMHTGVGCKHKATSQLSTHDWAKHAVTREAWTEVGDSELIQGSSERIGPYARSWLKRLNPGFMGIVSVTFIDLSGEDVGDAVAGIDAEADCPVRYLKAPGFSGDMWVGYATLQHEICKLIDFESEPTHPEEVALLGYFFDRYEPDHTANFEQIRGLLGLAGLSLGAVLFSGVDVASLKEAGRSGIVVELPYARPAKRLKRLLKRRTVVRTELPMGIRGTSAWLRQVARETGRYSAALETSITDREQRVWSQLRKVADRWRALRVAVFAEVPLAVGLVAMLAEMGLEPVLVGLRGEGLGSKRVFREGLEALGVVLASECEVLENPSLAATKAQVEARLSEDALDGIFAASTELNTISTIRPDVHMRRYAGGPMQPQGPFIVEIGFPAQDWHVTQPTPFMGWGGVLVMAQRILNAPRLWNAGRRPGFRM